jgi:hypothetical protein
MSTAGYGFGGMIPGSRDSIPNVIFNPAGMTEIGGLVLHVNGKYTIETITGMEPGKQTEEKNGFYQGGFTIGLPIPLWRNKVYIAGTIDWNIRPELDFIKDRYYWYEIEPDQSKVSVTRIGLGVGYKLSDIFNLGISINRWLGEIVQEYSINGVGYIGNIEYNYQGMHVTMELSLITKKVMVGLLWQSPMTLVKSEFPIISNEPIYNKRVTNHNFSGAGGAGLAYHIYSSFSIGLGYWRQIASNLRDNDISAVSIKGFKHLTAGLNHSCYLFKNPIRTFLIYTRAWLPDRMPITERLQNHLMLGVSSRLYQFGLYTSLKWIRDDYSQMTPILPPYS